MVDLSLIRAPLFVPAHRPDRFAKAAASGADGLILDLEDAVPAAEKDAARAALAVDFTTLPVLVRVNARGTSWHDADLRAVKALRPAGVILPKTASAQDVAMLRQATGLPVLALIESAEGLAAARSIAAGGAARLVFGSIDFCADLGVAHDRDVLLPVRSELVLASRLAGIAAPVDGVTVALDDPEACEDDARHARRLGMTGKLCIHPRQIDAVQRAFLPSAAERTWAQRVLASGDGAVSVDGAMVDEPVRIRARAILAATRSVP